jgi:hypothetical protein
MPYLKCEVCGEEVYRRPSHLLNHVFCTKHSTTNSYGNIKRRGKHNKVKIKCDNCGETITRWPSRIKERNFCSCECMGKYNYRVRGNPMDDPIVRQTHKQAMSDKMSGENNPAKRPDVRFRMSEAQRGEKSIHWRGGITHGPYCEKWTEDLRVRTRAFQGNICLLCGITMEEEGRQLTCHHVNFDKMMCCNDGYPMIAVLCVSCHGKVGFGRDETRDVFESLIFDKWAGKSFYSAEEWYTMLQSGEAKIEDYTIYPSKALNQLRRLLK